MLNIPAFRFLTRYFALLLVLVSCTLITTTDTQAKGQGPISVWAADERYVIIAEKAYPGVVLIDLVSGVTLERREITHDLPEGARVPSGFEQPKGIASCAKCDFIFVSGLSGDFWLLHLEDTVEQLLADKGRLGLPEARIEDLDISSGGTALLDGRMLLVSEDTKTAYIASSDDRTVFEMPFDDPSNARVFLQGKKIKPFGLNWDKQGGILVSMHKRYVWRMTLSGELLQVYDINAANCPGVHTLKPNLRAAVDDPLDENSLLILASNPKSYDAALWRLTIDDQGVQSCINVAGHIGRDPGWVDAVGEDIIFSRPHYFTTRPNTDPPQAILPDIDNRAVRLLNLKTLESTTVMYNRDIRLANLPQEGLLSAASCAKLNWANAKVSTTPAGQTSCARPPAADALALNLAAARKHCRAEGARLCEPSELRSSGVAGKDTAWTRADCASCWLRKAKGVCAADIKTYKTPGVHGDATFEQSWNSGHALEVADSATGGAATLCRPLDDNLKAAAPCCADISKPVVAPVAAPAAATAHDESR